MRKSAGSIIKNKSLKSIPTYYTKYLSAKIIAHFCSIYFSAKLMAPKNVKKVASTKVQVVLRCLWLIVLSRMFPKNKNINIIVKLFTTYLFRSEINFSLLSGINEWDVILKEESDDLSMFRIKYLNIAIDNTQHCYLLLY